MAAGKEAGYTDFISFFAKQKTYSSKMAGIPGCARRTAPWMAL
jgi:hypothetical protein